MPYFDDNRRDSQRRTLRGTSSRSRDASYASRSRDSRAGAHEPLHGGQDRGRDRGWDRGRNRDRERGRDHSRDQDRVNPRHPLTTQESYDINRMSRESYERARAKRDPSQALQRGRTANRELIDARGSIDSRAFNENNQLIGYTIDKQDTHDPLIETQGAGSRWRSQSAEGGGRSRALRGSDLDRLSDTISGRNQYSRKPASPEIPGVVKFLVALIVVLLIVLAVILFI